MCISNKFLKVSRCNWQGTTPENPEGVLQPLCVLPHETVQHHQVILLGKPQSVVQTLPYLQADRGSHGKAFLVASVLLLFLSSMSFSRKGATFQSMTKQT
jgi:hypothetical protein